MRWLDRYRRALSVAAAVLLAIVAMWWLADWLGSDWPRFHVTTLSVFAGVISWWTVEVALAWVTALWETECDRLARDRGLPRAEIVRRRR